MHTAKIKTDSINPLFVKRFDLSIEVRLKIVTLVLFFYTHGIVTRLSNKYNISRTYLYTMCKDFEQRSLNFTNPEENKLNHSKNLEYIFSQRLEGKCSITSISVILKRMGVKNASVGYISEILKNAGKKVGNNLNINNKEQLKFVFCSDEIFSGSMPILITVCPVSFAILNIELLDNRKGESWVNHWQLLLDQNVIPISIVKDSGKGMQLGKDIIFPDISQQADTFHSVAHRLGLWRIRIEKHAFRSINEEYNAEDLLNKAKSEKQIIKRKNQHIKAIEQCNKDIEMYENFTFLYNCLIECFNVFDKNGIIKEASVVEQDFDLALELIKSIDNKEINKEIESIENCKKDLFLFLNTAHKIVDELNQKCDNETLKILFLAWQNNKHSIKAKQSLRKNTLKRKEQYLLQKVKERIGGNYQITKNAVYEKLNLIIQSSAAVEAVNSILRPYLNTSKNQPTQEFLNLFMFYHNRRRFIRGERKGKTPLEIATGKTQDKDWFDLLINEIGIN